MAETANKFVPATSRRGFFVRNLGVIALAALFLRLITAWELGSAFGGSNNVFQPSSSSDLATYMTLAKQITTGSYEGVFYYQPFYYVVFLPVIYWVSNSSIWAVVFVQAVLSAATVYIAGLLGALIFNRCAGYLAAVITAVSTPLLLYVPYHQNETLQTFNITLLLFLTLKALKKHNFLSWAWAGGILSVAVLTRGNALLFMPLILIAMFVSAYRRKASWKHVFGCIFAFVSLFAVLQLPFIIHNTQVRGFFTGASTAANAVLALGNSPEAPPGGRNPGLPAGAMSYPESFHRMMNLVNHGVSIPEQMFNWFLREPLAFTELQFRKLLLFWEYREIPNNVSLYTDGQLSMVIRLLLPGRSVVLLSICASAMLGLIARCWKKRDLKLILLYAFIICYWFAVALFYILSRFRAPILPLMAVMGAGGVVLWCRRFRFLKERSKFFISSGFAVIGGFFLVCGSYDFYRENFESFFRRIALPQGVKLDLNGKDIQYFDHGPYTYGGWTHLQLEPGMRLRKCFGGLTNETGILQWSFVPAQPGVIAIRINDLVRSVDLPNPGRENHLLLPVALENGVVELEVIYLSTGVISLYDRQRVYQRSSLDGKLLNGEWVTRFIIEKPKIKE